MLCIYVKYNVWKDIMIRDPWLVMSYIQMMSHIRYLSLYQVFLTHIDVSIYFYFSDAVLMRPLSSQNTQAHGFVKDVSSGL